MRRAFTAIELAVVLVIILVLAVMILPVLEESYDEAERTKCLSRVRQVGIALETYQMGHDYAWPSVRRSVHPDHPEWPDPTASLAVLYPAYAPKAFLFQCPATDDVVLFDPGERDFLNCGNFYVSPKGKATREEDKGKGRPYPPSYFYEGGGPFGAGIPRDVRSGRVVYGDECVHGYYQNDAGRGFWLGETNHPQRGGNFLFADKSAHWLPVLWRGEPWKKGLGLPYVPNPRYHLQRTGKHGRPYQVIMDSNVFADDWQGAYHEADADLAGMMWVDGTWMEF